MNVKAKGWIVVVLLCMFSIMAVGCSSTTPTKETTPDATEQESMESSNMILATTTSTQDSGLLDYLLPYFTEDTGYTVDVIAVGTGKALQMGVDGEADVLLVHARASEDEFMANGDGIARYDVMYNDFVLVGPSSDPAGVLGLDNKIADALTAISQGEATFVSRGDDSGTHKKELAIWKTANIEPAGDWYVSAGAGMGEVLKMADEMQGYTIADRATYLAMSSDIDLVIVCEKDDSMLNPYGVLTVNPEKNQYINAEGANAFAQWIIGEHGQQLIGEFGVEQYGAPLFTPDAK